MYNVGYQVNTFLHIFTRRSYVERLVFITLKFELYSCFRFNCYRKDENSKQSCQMLWSVILFRFMVNRKIFLVGFGLYGSIHGATEYAVTIQVIHQVINYCCSWLFVL